MSEKFSPQAIQVMRRLVESSDKPTNLQALGKAKVNRLLKMDTANEVLIRHKSGQVVITRKAFQPIFDMIAGVFVEEGMVEKQNLRLVQSPEAEKPKDSDSQDGESENLPKGDKTE